MDSSWKRKRIWRLMKTFIMTVLILCSLKNLPSIKNIQSTQVTASISPRMAARLYLSIFQFSSFYKTLSHRTLAYLCNSIPSFSNREFLLITLESFSSLTGEPWVKTVKIIKIAIPRVKARSIFLSTQQWPCSCLCLRLARDPDKIWLLYHAYFSLYKQTIKQY